MILLSFIGKSGKLLLLSKVAALLKICTSLITVEAPCSVDAFYMRRLLSHYFFLSICLLALPNFMLFKFCVCTVHFIAVMLIHFDVSVFYVQIRNGLKLYIYI